jgi:dihydroorotate dehydrogenase electron transfer subunit
MKTELGPITYKKRLNDTTFDIWVLAPETAALARPGQFVMVKCEDCTLRRPISLCEIDRPAGRIRLVFDVRGEGTSWLAGRKTGDVLDVFGPLGNGFELGDTKQSAVFVGGGIGVPPLLAASKPFGEKAVVLLGFKSASDAILAGDFRSNGARVLLATDDGSAGHFGPVTGLLEKELKSGRPAAVFTCGPRAMLRAVAFLAAQYRVPCFASMEERMACGVGACLGCAIKVREGEGFKFLHVCKDGPVFDAQKIVW